MQLQVKVADKCQYLEGEIAFSCSDAGSGMETCPSASFQLAFGIHYGHDAASGVESFSFKLFLKVRNTDKICMCMLAGTGSFMWPDSSSVIPQPGPMEL